MVAPDISSTDLDEAGDLLRHAGREYWFQLGWHTTVYDGRLLLDLDDDTWGLLMPTGLAADLVAELNTTRLGCPVVMLPDNTESRSVLLVEPTSREATVPAMPATVSKLPAGSQVPLPPSRTEWGPVRWLAPQDQAGVARPPLAAIADALAVLAR